MKKFGNGFGMIEIVFYKKIKIGEISTRDLDVFRK